MRSTDHLSIQKYIYLASVASTNDFLIKYSAKNNPSHNICVYSFNQVGGKGQFGRKWFSDRDKNISLSYLLHFSKLPAKDHFVLNKSISLAFLDFFKNHTESSHLKIKWPNDIYYNNKKIGGLLVQNQIKGQLISQSIIGLGFNINQKKFPKTLKCATSLLLETGQQINITRISYSLSSYFPARLMYYLNNTVARDSSYQEQLYGLGQPLSFKDNNGELFTGTIEGVEETGRLIIKQNGERRHFNHGEIHFL